MAEAKRPVGMGAMILAGAGGLLLIAIVIIFFASAGRSHREEECQFHMMLLWRAVGVGDPAEPEAWDRFTGRAFWDRHEEWPAPFPVEIKRTYLICPVFDRTRPGFGVEHVDYRGPTKGLRRLGPADPLGADRPGNHPGIGNVILKSGTLVTDADAWTRASTLTSD